jgi:hypothetical protein
MNRLNFILRRAPVAAVLLTAILVMPAVHAQSAAGTVDNRFLFIYGTSADMKNRVPALQTEMNNLLVHSLGDQLRAGDSIGVWTFDQNLHTGQYPLQRWDPAQAGNISSNINRFVGKLHYAKRTSFNALQPRLNQVIRNSEQLTVLIFCDGEDQIKWTPYDAGINQVLQQRQAELKKSRQPFVLVLRTQRGEYIGCTVNFPPGMVNFPQFPPLEPPTPEPKPAPASAPSATSPPPAPTNPAPLIIIGTKVETNWPPVSTNSTLAMSTNLAPLPSTNPPSLAANLPQLPLATNPTPAVVTDTAPVLPAKTIPSTPTNLVAPAKPAGPLPENSVSNHKGTLVLGVALLIAAFALVVLTFTRTHRSGRNSLITRSMEKD